MASNQDQEHSRPETIRGDTPHIPYDFQDNEKKHTSTGVLEVAVDVPIESYIPDGGLQAWLVVLGGHTSTFAAFGFINAWGVFQEYYEQNLLREESTSKIAWIGSIQYALVFMPGLLVGRLLDQGYFRVPYTLASAGLITATFLIAQCTKYWHFLLCQGFFVGLSAGVIIILGLGVLPQWFKAKRGFVLGLIAIGASFGGVVYPIAARRLIPIVGFKWTMRILGFIHVFLLAIANLCTKRRLPPKHSQTSISLRAFTNPPFAFYCAAGFMAFLGLYTVLTYISVSAKESGIADDFAFYYVAIVNAGGALGRGILGRMGDRFGPLSVIAPSTFVAGVLTYAWPFVTSKGGLIAVGIVYGVASGGFLALLGAPTAHMGDLQENGTRLGLFLTCMSLGALAGPPISGAIKDKTGSFTLVGVWAGTAIMLSVVLFTLARYSQLRGWSGKA
ncbi:MFS general substrate transporter [Irpex rosettiformis]|uniref:MFS general substrate transporter n=1 Tax=Irpex rosettiformis TaxID=378272 RepID=A0ACB8TYK7_9APHY|nr:MFS general substrate transporter [Irpex rosettiformis]